MLSQYVLPRWLRAPDGAPAASPNQPPPEETPDAKLARETKEAEDAAAAAAAAEPVEGKDDPLLASLIAGYKDEEPKPIEAAPEEDEEAKKVREAKEAEDAAAAEAANKAAATPPPAPPKPSARKTILPDDEPAPPPAPQPAPTPTPAPQPDTEAAYIAGLTDEQKDELVEAEYAAKLNPGKYGNRRKELLEFYRRIDATYQKLNTEKGGEEGFDAVNDPEYKRAFNSKPRMDLVDQKRVTRSMGADEGAKKVREEIAPELQQVKRTQEEIAVAPKLDTVANNFGKAAQEMFATDDKSVMAPVMKLMTEKGFAEAAKEYPLETEIVSEEVTHGKTMAKEYVRIVHMAKKGHQVFDQSNPVHSEIIDFVNREGEEFARAGGELLVRQGKRFLPRAQYAELNRTNPAELHKHWTFSDQDVLGMMAENTKSKVERRINEEVERAAKRGFVRSKAGNSPTTTNQPSNEPQPLTPPKAASTIAKGGKGVVKNSEISVSESLYK